MLSQLYNNFISFPYFFPSYETCSINVNPLFHAAIKNLHIKTFQHLGSSLIYFPTTFSGDINNVTNQHTQQYIPIAKSFQLDTGADVTVIPNRFLRKNSPIVWEKNKKLNGPGHKEIQVIGHVEAILDYGKISLKQDLYMVKKLEEPLLGWPAIKALKILGKINTINESDRYEKEFPSVFKGFGKLENVYKIHLNETAQPFSIATSRRLPIPMKQKVQQELKRLEKR